MRALDSDTFLSTAEISAMAGAPRGWEGMAVRVRDAETLRRLAAFFPHAWDGRESGVGGGWYPALGVEFFLEDGSSRKVLVSPNLKYYSARGDWPLHPEFKGFVERLAQGGGEP
jgi:hypothetical protein